MTLSRWKIMAGMFGVSVAGIYALAGPGTYAAETKGVPPAVKFAEPPLVVPVSGVIPVSAPAAELVVPAAPVAVSEPLALPTTLPADLPAAPPLLTVPEPAPTVPVAAPVAAAMPSSVTLPKADVMPPPRKIEATLPTPVVPSTSAPAAPQAMPIVFAEVPSTPVIESTPPIPVAATEVVTTVAPKFRIVLRVGEGEPVFEVRSGDNLVMKVVSEKVDVKSPLEKGQSLSSVKALGKVRFVGFGSEGSCEELSFLAGTGEVSLSGSVRVQVKDKLGRTESELTGDKMNYRLDYSNTTLSGGLEP